MADNPELLITSSRPPTSKGKAVVRAMLGDECLHADTIDVNKKDDREAFVARLAEGRDWVDRTVVEQKLLNPEPHDDRSTSGGESGDGKAGFESQAQTLLRLADEASLFHTEDGKPFATLQVGEHRENHPIRSSSFRRWLIRAYFAERDSPPSSEAMQAALGVLEAKAEFDGPLERIWTRVAEGPGLPGDPTYYLDLCNSNWQAVEIKSQGWRVVDDPPVKFRRAKGMMAMPTPEPGGSIADLRSFVNVNTDTDDDWRLLVAALTAALLPRGPYPIVAMNGEQGSAKSTTTRVLRKLIDPNATLLRCEPREVRDLMIAATNAWAVTLDNLSSLPTWLSDALCRLATGGGFATRTLYENDEETHFSAMRPVLLNGIEDVATRFDLLDRCLVFTLPTIPEEKRREEGPFWRSFEASHPRILGALLDAVVGGLRTLPSVRLERLPRMADFARWGEAVGRSLDWGDGTFLKAYEENRLAADEQAIEGSEVATAICSLVASGTFEGTARELLDRLAEAAGEKASRSKSWPQSPRGMTGAVKRVVPALRKLGIEVTKPAKRRMKIERTALDKGGEQPSEPPKPSSATGAIAATNYSPNGLRNGDGRGGCPSTGGPTARTALNRQGQPPEDPDTPKCLEAKKLEVTNGVAVDGRDGSGGSPPTLSADQDRVEELL